jgi:hypothetical protein
MYNSIITWIHQKSQVFGGGEKPIKWRVIYGIAKKITKISRFYDRNTWIGDT